MVTADLQLMPEKVTWDMEPPVKPDADGNYPIAMPGQTVALMTFVVKGLSDDGAPSIGQVAEQLLLRHHSASELVHRAEESRLVRTRPDEADHRLIRVAVTVRGERVLARLAPLHVEELARLAPLIAGLVR